MTVLASTGLDLEPLITSAADAFSLPPVLLLACAIAEGSLNPLAQRWGSRDIYEKAMEAIADEDWVSLQDYIYLAWPDISFGVAQRIVKYHWAGDRTSSYENCLAVREAVFADPAQDILEMGRFLHTHWLNAAKANLTPTDGDRMLMTLCAYNAGHIPLPSEDYWVNRRSTINRYATALVEADRMLFSSEEEGTVSEDITTPEGPLGIEGFIEKFPEQAIWTPDGSAGEPIVVNERVRLAGTATHVLVEFDGWVSPLKIDMSFFAQPPQA